jgi:AmiR/NasT family two-component response regulator
MSFHAGLDSRTMLAMATGILMERYGLERARAAALLVKVSERSDVPVETLARRVLGTAGLNRLTPGTSSE